MVIFKLLLIKRYIWAKTKLYKEPQQGEDWYVSKKSFCKLQSGLSSIRTIRLLLSTQNSENQTLRPASDLQVSCVLISLHLIQEIQFHRAKELEMYSFKELIFPALGSPRLNREGRGMSLSSTNT